jgi:hypothetical protein
MSQLPIIPSLLFPRRGEVGRQLFAALTSSAHVGTAASFEMTPLSENGTSAACRTLSSRYTDYGASRR